MRGYNTFLVTIGVVSAALLALPHLVLVLGFLQWRLPLQLAMLLPAIAFVLILARVLEIVVLRKFLPRWDGPANTVAAIAVTLLPLAALSLIANQLQQVRIDRMVQGDMDALPQRVGGVVALRRFDQAEQCDDLCQRLLLTANASRVLIERHTRHEAAIVPDAMVASFRFEPGDTCAPPDITDDQQERLLIRLGDGIDRNAPRPQDTSTLMAARVASGDCLIKEMVPIGSADLILTMMTIVRKPTADQAGFSFGQDLIRADRLSVHRREGAEFTETFRWTGVTADAMAPIAVPVLTLGDQFATTRGFMRKTVTRNIDTAQIGEVAWVQVMSDRLALNLTPTGRDDVGVTRDAITAMLDRGGRLDENAQRLIAEHLEGFGGRTSSDPLDHALFLRLVADDRVRLDMRSLGAQPPMDAFGPADQLTLAEAAMARIRRSEPLGNEDTHAASQILLKMPTQMLEPYWQDLVRLSENRDMRWQMQGLMTRLADFGDAGAERLVFLISDAQTPTEGQSPQVFEVPYSAGMVGLCRMGAGASAQKTALKVLGTEGRLVFKDRLANGSVQTLISLGFTQQEITEFAANAPGSMRADQLLAEIRNADRTRSCSF